MAQVIDLNLHCDAPHGISEDGVVTLDAISFILDTRCMAGGYGMPSVLEAFQRDLYELGDLVGDIVCRVGIFLLIRGLKIQ